VGTFDPSRMVTRLYRDGSSEVVEPAPGPPVRIDGFNVGAPFIDGNAPHRGELHPDGDELLYVISGRVEVILDDGDETAVGTERVETLGPGEAFIVPKGTWHRVHVVEPSHFLHVTPGPGGAHRPL
jgi:mannose-6-phosphate isomerase-like protein (cupin superfamily)